MKNTYTNTLTSFLGNSRRAVGLFVLMLSLFTLAPADLVVFFDDFSGANNVNLSGTAPSTRPGSEIWDANNEWKADGTYTLEENSPARNRRAFLPFSSFSTPDLYTLSATISSVENVNTSIGLIKGTPSTTDSASNTFALFLSLDGRDGFAGQARARGDHGFGNQQVASSFTYGEATTLNLQLDTRGDTWTASFWVNDGDPTTPIELDDAFKTSFTGVGFHAAKANTTFDPNTQIIVDDFTLTVIPEPGTFMLLGIGFVAILLGKFIKR